MLPSWLSLKLFLVGVLASLIAMGVLFGLWQWEKIQTGKLENMVEYLKGEVDSLNTQIAKRDTIINEQQMNLEAVRDEFMAFKDSAAKAKKIKTAIAKLPSSPEGKACETSDRLGVDYAKVANSITRLYTDRVRGKITSKRTDNSDTTPKSVPDPGGARVE